MEFNIGDIVKLDTEFANARISFFKNVLGVDLDPEHAIYKGNSAEDEDIASLEFLTADGEPSGFILTGASTKFTKVSVI